MQHLCLQLQVGEASEIVCHKVLWLFRQGCMSLPCLGFFDSGTA